MSADRRAYMQAYYAAHAEAVKAKVAAWAKANPERAKSNARKRSAAYRLRNLDEVSKKLASWRSENPDWQRLWRAANADSVRAYKLKRRAAGHVTRTCVRDALRVCNGVCEYCLTAPASSIDHVVPVARGGLSEAANLAGACMRCNRAKSDRTPLEFLCRLPRLGVAA